MVILGNQISGAGSLVAPLGASLPDGSRIAPTALSRGFLNEKQIIAFSMSTLGITWEIGMDYDNDYDRPSELSIVEGVYSTVEMFDTSNASFVISANGDLQGQFTTGGGLNCDYLGTVAVIDPLFNAYDVAVTVSNCGVRGMCPG